MTFFAEFAYPLALSFTCVILVILVITADIVATLVVALCVVMTDLFLSGLIFYWNLSLNPISLLQIILGIGCSVDFSAHIAYAYLVEDVTPLVKKNATKSEIRKMKAQMALSKMGSSVFHGGFSTFLALTVLAPSQTYIFIVFYRMWFGIILFGMANGFLLLPVILSFVGGTDTTVDHSVLETNTDIKETSESHKESRSYENVSSHNKSDAPFANDFQTPGNARTSSMGELSK